MFVARGGRWGIPGGSGCLVGRVVGGWLGGGCARGGVRGGRGARQKEMATRREGRLKYSFSKFFLMSSCKNVSGILDTGAIDICKIENLKDKKILEDALMTSIAGISAAMKNTG